MSAAHHAAVLAGAHKVVDLRSVIRTAGCRSYWRSDDLQMMGALGVTSRMENFNGTSTSGGDVVPTSALNRVLSIRVTITVDGGYGVGQFNCTITTPAGATTMTGVTIQSSVALTGVGTGTSLVFSNTTFSSSGPDIFQNVMGYWPFRGHGSDLVRTPTDYLLGSRLGFGDGVTLPSGIVFAVTEAGGGAGDDGQYLPSTSLVMPAPGTTPTYISAIVRQSAITGALVERSICLGTGTSNFRIWIRQDGQVTINNGTARVWPSYTFAKFGTWFRLRAYFSNSASDMLQLGADTTTFASAGNNSDTSFQLLRPSNEGVVGTAGPQAVAEFSIWNGLPTSHEMAHEDAYYTARYGAAPLAA